MLVRPRMRRLSLVMSGAAVTALASGVIGWFATRILLELI
jgi:hypothetical protein